MLGREIINKGLNKKEEDTFKVPHATLEPHEILTGRASSILQVGSNSDQAVKVHTMTDLHILKRENLSIVPEKLKQHLKILEEFGIPSAYSSCWVDAIEIEEMKSKRKIPAVFTVTKLISGEQLETAKFTEEIFNAFVKLIEGLVKYVKHCIENDFDSSLADIFRFGGQYVYTNSGSPKFVLVDIDPRFRDRKEFSINLEFLEKMLRVFEDKFVGMKEKHRKEIFRLLAQIASVKPSKILEFK